jgi:hypothetical protein
MAIKLPITNVSYKKPLPSDWVRPSDWIVITDNANEFQALVADTGDATYTIQYSVTGTGNTTFDWGDGTSNTASGTVALSTFTKTYTPGTGTSCSRGYTTFRIRVTKAAGITVNSIRFIGSTTTFQNQQTGVGVLEVYYGNNVMTSNSPAGFFSGFTGTNSILSFNMLEYVKFPATVTYGSFNNAFQNCYNLRVVVMPTSASTLTTFVNAFSNCNSLRSITFPSNATGISSLQGAFSGCTSLISCILPTSLNLCVNLSNAFSSCRSLESITIPSINTCTNLSSMFTSCTNLLWVRFNSLPAPASAGVTVNMSTTFNQCLSLQYIYFPGTCSSNAIYNCSSTFNGCETLRNITFPINFNASTLANAFQTCYNIYSIIFQSAMPNCTSFNTAFASCKQLQVFTFPSSVSSSGIDMASAFNQCISLTSITIPTTYTITSLLSTFGGCPSLKTVTINSAQNSCTTLANTFSSCFSLTTVVLPTSLNACNSLNGMFNTCYSLQSVTFPATMNAVTTTSAAFNQCFSLTSVTMPTSMSACTNFESIFSQCSSLITVTFPATISTATSTFNSAIRFCNNLKTVTLPATRSTSLNSLNTFAYGCGQLTTINNLNLLGSTTATPLVDGTSLGWFTSKITSLTFTCPFSSLQIFGNNTTNIPIALNSLRLTNASAGQWTGGSPQIYLQFTSLSTAALNTLFGDIAAQGNVTSKTIDITGTVGAAGLTPANRLVLTSRGWTITG